MISFACFQEKSDSLLQGRHFTGAREINTHCWLHTSVLVHTHTHTQKINHRRKMKDTCAGAPRADKHLQAIPSSGLWTSEGHSVCPSLGRGKRSNSSCRTIDFHYALSDRVTHTHTHRHTLTLSIIPSLLTCLSVTLSHAHRLQRIPGGEDLHSHAMPTNDILYKWQQWQFWHSLDNTRLAKICEYEQIHTMEVSSVYMNTLLLRCK